jgi:EmrB/QacA subfamily drug resistance transporter
VFLVVVDNTIVNVALPSLQRDLHASTSALQWIVDGYSLPFAALLLAGAGLADRLGRKRVMHVGLLLFGVFSVGAAFSTSSAGLIIFRALMGASAAFVFPATQSILTVAFPDPSERAKAFGLWGAVSGLAVAFGPITGGLLITHYWYGSVFLVNVPLVLIALGLGLWLIPETKAPDKRPLDVIGLALGTGAVTTLVLALIQGPSWGWRSTTTLGLFAASALLFAAFTKFELRRTYPLFDVRMFRSGSFSGGAVGIGLAFFSLFGFIFLVTQYFQEVRGMSPLSAGLHTLPFALTTMVMMPLAAVLALRIGVRYVVVTGVVLMAIGMSMVTMAIGFSLINPPSTASIMGSLEPHQIASGSAVNSVTRELGGTLGVAVSGSVFSSLFTPGMTTLLAPYQDQITPEAAKAATTSMAAAHQVATSLASHLPGPLGDALTSGVSSAFMTSFHRACIVIAIVGVIGAVAVFAPLSPKPATKETVRFE